MNFPTTSPLRSAAIGRETLARYARRPPWLDDPSLLSQAARDAIGDGRNSVYVSAAVAWEIAIKRSLGKLEAPDDLEAALAANRFQPLPITIPHALAIAALPDHHRDPFDRLLIAQACHEGLTLVSRDQQVARYPVTLLIA